MDELDGGGQFMDRFRRLENRPSLFGAFGRDQDWPLRGQGKADLFRLSSCWGPESMGDLEDSERDDLEAWMVGDGMISTRGGFSPRWSRRWELGRTGPAASPSSRPG